MQIGWRIGVTVDYGIYNVGVGYGIDFNKIADESKFGILSVNIGMDF